MLEIYFKFHQYLGNHYKLTQSLPTGGWCVVDLVLLVLVLVVLVVIVLVFLELVVLVQLVMLVMLVLECR